MGTRNKRAERCDGCRLHVERCICNDLVPLPTTTRLAVIAHRRELTKTTNTGTFAARILTNSTVLSWGDEGTVIAEADLASPEYQPIILAHDAPPLSRETLLAEVGAGPFCLVTPDGSWRQASKMARRIPALRAIPRFSLPPGPPTRYILRDEPKDGGLATFEAIARALGIIEGAAVETTLMRYFDALVSATLAMRGQADPR